MRVVLVEPEIPPNTGNIARTCAATATSLHLIEPLGFSLDDRYLKRAGVDYWHLVDVYRHGSWDGFLETTGLSLEKDRFHLFTSHGGENYASVDYGADDILVFGKESSGLPHALTDHYHHLCRQIPMTGKVRSLNLSNAVAIVVYEALRQRGHAGLTLN